MKRKGRELCKHWKALIALNDDVHVYLCLWVLDIMNLQELGVWEQCFSSLFVPEFDNIYQINDILLA